MLVVCINSATEVHPSLFNISNCLNDIDQIFLRSLSVINNGVRNFPLFRFPGKESGYCPEIYYWLSSISVQLSDLMIRCDGRKMPYSR